jgi:hypothetical protein
MAKQDTGDALLVFRGTYGRSLVLTACALRSGFTRERILEAWAKRSTLAPLAAIYDARTKANKEAHRLLDAGGASRTDLAYVMSEAKAAIEGEFEVRIPVVKAKAW